MTPSAQRHLVVVGAGFSAAANLPLASDFTRRLLDATGLRRENRVLIDYLHEFVDETFGGGSAVDVGLWPDLEDLFTTIDLAANTGHNLGRTYSAADLRTLRRALIVRTIRMLHRELVRGAPAGEPRKIEARRRLSRFLDAIPLARTAFLSMNWDTVIEQAIIPSAGSRPARGTIDYGCGALPARFSGPGIVPEPDGGLPALTLLKPHGSINWMYCDCCSALWWFPPHQADSVAKRLFTPRDREKVAARFPAPPRVVQPAPCPACRADALATRFATFSYRKALDFPMHLATWREAEARLRSAESWTFIGYSMPAADYEFKHLLKRVQLSRATAPVIAVVTGGDDDAADRTIRTYQRFLGKRAIDATFRNGIDDDAITYLQRGGVLD